MRREGLPLQGFCIAAWIPSTENAKDTIAGLRNAGIEHVAFKPASANAIQQRRPEWPWYRQNTSPWLNFLFVLVRYPSTKSGEELTSLKDCITRMPEGQKGIYYLTGESLDSIRSSLFLERLKKKGYEILLMADLIDEYAATQLKEFEGQKLIRVSKEGLELDDDLSDDEKKSFEELTMTVKDIFGEKVEKGILSNRILVTVQFGWSANMERIMKAQALRDSSMSQFIASKKTLSEPPQRDCQGARLQGCPGQERPHRPGPGASPVRGLAPDLWIQPRQALRLCRPVVQAHLARSVH
ncbi:unnamed protein product [Tilletia laevis]|uniref:Uncharacterized protein n=1 Tax=Tilletia laevis TaxID=157183 RepID=A0A9N8LQD7_9BASI|nr:unnamed protein product [Tilletia laevis]